MVDKDITTNLREILTPVEITLLKRLPRKVKKDIYFAVLYGADMGTAIGKISVAETAGSDKGTNQALLMCSMFGREARQKIGFQTVLQACLDNGGFPDDLP